MSVAAQNGAAVPAVDQRQVMGAVAASCLGWALDLFDLFQQTLFVQTMSLKRGFAVVGDAHIFETQLICGVRHFLQRTLQKSIVIDVAND